MTKLLLVKRSLLTIMFAVASANLFYFFGDSFWNWYTIEDGPVENLTALALLTGALFFAYKLVVKYKERKALWVGFTALVAAVLFFAFGEELSWGQRIFSIESGDFFKENNLQGETNFHNLMLGDLKVNKIIFTYVLGGVFAVYFLLSLMLYNKVSWFKKLVDALGVPIPRFHHTLLFMGLTVMVAVIPDDKTWEVWECLFVLTFLYICVNPHNVGERLFKKMVRKEREMRASSGTYI